MPFALSSCHVAVLCEFDLGLCGVSDLRNSDRGFLLSFAGIVPAGFVFALIRVAERGSQSVSQAVASWHAMQCRRAAGCET